jgi:hypothetical protein
MSVCSQLESQLATIDGETRHLLDAVLYHALNDTDFTIEKSSVLQA